MPAVLVQQLALGGRLVAPVGDERGQQLMVVDRDESGFHTQALDNVIFVPMLKGTR